MFFDFASGVNKTSKDEQALQEEIAAMKEQIVSEVTLVQALRGDDTETITYTGAQNTIAKGCSICKEKFIKVWNEAEEEWSYKNAVVVDKMVRKHVDYRDRVVRLCRKMNNERRRYILELLLADTLFFPILFSCWDLFGSTF